MKPITTIIIAAVVGIVAAYGTVKTIAPQSEMITTEIQQPFHERIMETRTLKCGYLVAPPYFTQDSNTGKFGGIMYDIVEEMAKELSLKVEWVEEVNMSHMFEGFRTKRYDAICQAMAAIPERSLETDFTTPLFYNGTFLYARADDDRFHNIKNVQSNETKIAIIEGEYLNYTINDYFPKATPVVLPQLTDVGQVLLHVTTGKTDISIQSPEIAAEFLKHNPGTLKKVSHKPIRVLGSTIPIPKGEYKLKRMLDTTIQTLLNTGFIDRVVEKHSNPEFFIPVAKPYDVESD